MISRITFSQLLAPARRQLGVGFVELEQVGYNPVLPPLPLMEVGRKSKQPSPLSKIISLFTTVVLAISIVVGVVFFAPELYYKIVPVSSIAISAQEVGSVRGGDYAEGTETTKPQLEDAATLAASTRYLPPQDENLPQGEWLIIPRIGVRSKYIRTNLEENPDTALSRGVWFVPGYGEPGDINLPTILAAHRYPFDWMYANEYWQYNTFHLLPELEPGDTVEIIQDQRKYTYEIYAGEEADEISDYNADLILYTCKYLNSPIRHIRYARLLKAASI